MKEQVENILKQINTLSSELRELVSDKVEGFEEIKSITHINSLGMSGNDGNCSITEEYLFIETDAIEFIMLVTDTFDGSDNIGDICNPTFNEEQAAVFSRFVENMPYGDGDTNDGFIWALRNFFGLDRSEEGSEDIN